MALGGSSYAAIALPKNSVRAKQIATGAVRSAEIKDGALERQDFASGTLQQGPQGEPGARGPAGAAGADGAPGQPGAPGTARAFGFVNPGACTATAGSCEVTKSKNILGARRIGLGEYCLQVAADIDLTTTTTAAGVDFQRSDGPEGTGSAMTSATNPVCETGEFAVITARLGVSNGAVQAPLANGIAFWVLVP